MPIAAFEVLGIDQEIASDLLARFYERTVGDERFAVAHQNDGRRSPPAAVAMR